MHTYMFILRRVTPGKVEVNTCLGDYYTFISKEKNADEFKRTVEFWSKEDTEGVYALITYNDGADIMPLYTGSYYYVMTSDGRTFSNVSFR